MDNSNNSASFFEHLVNIANNGKQRLATLERVKEACDVLVSHGKDFSHMDVEVFCKRKFNKGPNAQTLYNDKNLDKYIKIRKSEVSLRKNKNTPISLSKQIETIEDLELKSRLRLLYEENEIKGNKIRMISSALARVHPPINIANLFSETPTVQTNENTAPFFASEPQRNALAKLLRLFFHKPTINRYGLDVDSGDIVSRGLRETLISKSDLDLLVQLYLLVGGADSFLKEVENMESTA